MYKKRVFRKRRFPHKRLRVSKAGLFVRSAEVKTLDVNVGSFALSTTATVTGCNFIRGGTDESQRVGRKIEMRSWQFSGFLQFGSSGTATPQDFCRIVLVYDRQTNGAAPGWADVFQTVNQAGVTDNSALALKNVDNEWRFKILMDHKIMISDFSNAAAEAGVASHVTDYAFNGIINKYIPLKGLTTQYQANSAPAVVGDIVSGGLFFMTKTYINAAGVQNFNLTGTLRLKYNDKT